MATLTSAAAVAIPKLQPTGVTANVVRTSGAVDGSIAATHLLLMKIPNRVTVLDGYVQFTSASMSCAASVIIGNTNTVSASFSVTSQNRFTGVPLKISISDDAANQYVWAEVNISGVASATTAWSLDLVVFYAPIGHAEMGT